MRKTLRVISVPFALGGRKGGVAHGPDALCAHGLLRHLGKICTSVHSVNVALEDVSAEMPSSPSALSGNIHAIGAVREMTRHVGAQVFIAHRLGQFPVVIGGDHSVSIGTLPQLLDPAISNGRRVGLLWIDAHYDAHTPKTSHSHYANGLPLASALGRGARSLGSFRTDSTGRRHRLHFLPTRVLHIGAGESDCESEEVALLEKLRVKTVAMRDMHRDGALSFMDPLRTFLGAVDDVVLTVDLDAIRKDFAPAVSFQSEYGMLPSQLFRMARTVAESGKLRQVEIMEYNPDFEEYGENDSPITAHLVFDLLATLLAIKQ
jgi:arginase